MREDPLERREAEAAAAEAAAIGGSTGTDPAEDPNDAQRPLREGGEGEAEGFEQAEAALIEHATHADQHAARRVIEDATRRRR